MNAVDRVTKHRALAGAGLVELKVRVDDVRLQELLIAWRILAPILCRENYTPAELSAGLEELVSTQCEMLEGALQRASGKCAPILVENNSHRKDEPQ